MPSKFSDAMDTSSTVAIVPVTPASVVSPVGRRLLIGTSNKKSSPQVFISPLTLNDDNAEKKRQRQLSKVLEMQQRNLVSPVGGDRYV